MAYPHGMSADYGREPDIASLFAPVAVEETFAGVLSEARDVLGQLDDPVDAELWVSDLIGALAASTAGPASLMKVLTASLVPAAEAGRSEGKARTAGQETRDAAHLYLSYGLLPVPAWAVRENGACRCPRGIACARPGKHPQSVRTGPGVHDYSWKPLTCRTHAEIDQRDDLTVHVQPPAHRGDYGGVLGLVQGQADLVPVGRGVAAGRVEQRQPGELAQDEDARGDQVTIAPRHP